MDSSNAVDSCSGWDNTSCEGTPYCPPRCPRFVDKHGVALLALPATDASIELEALVDLYDCDEEGRTVVYPPYRTRRSIMAWLTQLLERGWNVVAFDGARPVGHAVLTPSDAKEPEFGVFVDPAYWGRGIGGELLRQVIARAAAEGYRGIVMEVERGNRAMQSLATAHGFETVATPNPDDWLGFYSFRLALDRSPIVDRLGLVPTRQTA